MYERLTDEEIDHATKLAAQPFHTGNQIGHTIRRLLAEVEYLRQYEPAPAPVEVPVETAPAEQAEPAPLPDVVEHAKDFFETHGGEA